MAEQQVYLVEIWVDGKRIAEVRSLHERVLWDEVERIAGPYLRQGRTVELKEYYDNPDKPN